MGNQEKLDMILESILSLSEQINKNNYKSEPGKVQSISGNSLYDLDKLIDKLGALKIMTNRTTNDEVNKKLDAIILKLNNNREENKKEYPENSKSLFSFKYPFNVANNIHVIRVIIITILIFAVPSFFMFRNYNTYKQSHLKYAFLYYSGNQKYLHELDSIWGIDSLRQKRLRFIKQREKDLIIGSHEGSGKKSNEIDSKHSNIKK